jgi:hypothetical protein
MSRFYVFNYKKKIGLSVIHKMNNLVKNTNKKINNLFIEIHSNYASLSEEDKLLIDNIIELFY